VASYLLTLYVVYRNRLFRRPDFWWSALLFCVGLAPLVIYTWLWGRSNMQQASRRRLGKHSRLSPSTWSYVAGYEWPREVGWAVLALAIAYCTGCVLRKQWRLPKPALFFLVAWLLTGYAFFTLIACRLNVIPYSLFSHWWYSRYSQSYGALPGRIAPMSPRRWRLAASPIL